MKKGAIMLGWVVLALVVAGAVYVRAAPLQPKRWHVAPQVAADADLPQGVRRLVPADAMALERFDAVARAAPRTTVLAGDVSEGMVTYVTRSRVVGFPDYTTAMQDGADLKIFARLRFGRSDLGVNRARVDGWLRQAGLR
ncbi:MAG: DUF1499 domain-containing protein [Rhodobacteraceae bacterium]|nr:DUF1499 domain-containing protein [Paracoccaceae bacterium]